jgi:chemotaxis signal transduction protein
MVKMTSQLQQNEGVSQRQYSWFTIFLLAPETNAQKLNLRCMGCRELIKLDCKRPSHIRGVIEYNGLYMPVIDPSILLLGRPSKFNTLSCILVVPHRWEYQQFYTGIVMENIDEITELASCEPNANQVRNISINVRFALDLRKSPGAEAWLYENHQMLDICRNESQAEQDYIAFKRICEKQAINA